MECLGEEVTFAQLESFRSGNIWDDIRGGQACQDPHDREGPRILARLAAVTFADVTIRQFSLSSRVLKWAASLLKKPDPTPGCPQMPPKIRTTDKKKNANKSSSSSTMKASSATMESEPSPSTGSSSKPARIKMGGTTGGQQLISPVMHINPVPKEQIVDSVIQTTKCVRYRAQYAEPELTDYGGTLVEGKKTQENFGSVRLNCNISIDSAKLQLLSSLSQCMLAYLEEADRGLSAQSNSASSSKPKGGSQASSSSGSSSAETAAANKHAEVQIGYDDRGMYIASNAGCVDINTYLNMLKWVQRQSGAEPDSERPLTRAIARIQSVFCADEQREANLAEVRQNHLEAIAQLQTSRDRRIKLGTMAPDEVKKIFDFESEKAEKKLGDFNAAVLNKTIEKSPWFRNVVDRTIGRTNLGELAGLYHFLRILRTGEGIAGSMNLIAEVIWAGKLSIVHAELRVVRAAWLIGSGKLLLSGAKRACWGCYNVLKELDEHAVDALKSNFTQSSSSTPLPTATASSATTRPRSASLSPSDSSSPVPSTRARSNSSSSQLGRHVPELFNILRLIDDDIPGGAFPKSYCGVLSGDRATIDKAPEKNDLAANLTRRRSVIFFKD